MRAPDPNLLHAAVDWQSSKAELLLAQGVESRVVGPTTDLSKNSATIEFISSRLLVAVSIWDSGECEVITDSPDNRHPEPAVQVFRLADATAVGVLLDRLVAGLAGEG